MRGFHIFTTFSSFFLILISLLCSIHAYHHDEKKANSSWVVKRDQRTILAHTEYGEISAVNITDGLRGGPYLLQFLTLEPNSLFLPVLLHADAVFYVHTGSGTLSWTDEDLVRNVDIKRGDVYTVPAGSLFYVQSKLESERQKLRIHVIFSNTDDGIYNPSVGAYSGIRDLIVGFDRRVLQAAFQVSEEVLDEVTNGSRPPPIVHAVAKKKTGESMLWELEARFLKSFMGGSSSEMINKKKKKPKKKAYNIFDKDPDFKNCNGWSTTVNREDSSSLGESNIGVFMVNLTKGSMMGPHWNPSATEMAVVLHGQGMIRVVCSANWTDPHCRNMRVRVEEGDVFGVPRFHPMAQMSFNNDSFVFMGFSTSTRKNYPQFLAGKRSVLQVLDRYVLGMSFNVTNSTIDRLLEAQTDSIILDCTSCAEEEERVMEEEIRRKKEKEEEERRREEEEARRREEEEAKRREEEEARRREEERRQREEEEARRREEEERKRKEEEEARRRREEEAKKREEEEAKREEEEAKREEEERRRREEEEEARKREEEEAKREEEERRRREEEEEARKREEEEAKREEEERRRREEEEERRWREEEEAKREEEEKRRREEEDERRRQEEEEEARRREEEEAKREEEERRWREEEEAKREEEERRQREEKEAKRRQEEEAMREEEEAKKEEERRRRQEESRRREEQEEARRWEEEEERRREEEARRHEEEEARQRKEHEKESPRTKEEEVASKEYEERQRKAAEEQAKRERRRREDQIGGGSGGGSDGRRNVFKF